MSLFDNIGNFLFPNNGNLSKEEEKKEEKKHQDQYLEMMYMYQRYYGVVETKKYVLQGSILSCQYGTKLSKLDCLEDHGVYSGGNPVMTISDCADSNIHSFGSCLCPEKNYEGRLPMTVAQDSKGTPAKKAPGNNYAHICVPVINENSVWHQVDSKVLIELKQKGYAPILSESAVLVCQYGGVICVKEVPKTNVANKLSSETEDYFVIIARGNLTVRNLPSSNGKELANFSSGKDIKIVLPKTTKMAEGRSWIKVYCDVEKTKMGWVAEDYVHPNIQVITEFPENEYNNISGLVDGKKKVLTPAKSWWVLGMGEYGLEEVPKDYNGRYRVAVGPRVIYKKYPDNGPCNRDDFNGFSRFIEVELENIISKKRRIIKCVIDDIKAHTYSKYPDGHTEKSSTVKNASFKVENGILQTGIRYPKASNGLVVGIGNMDGSVIEFKGGKFSDFLLKDYRIIKVISNVQRTDLFVDQK